ncbi:MAG: ATP-binding protein [Planctomycetota bacterium]|nr:ATP-binding protein [Planctomycetota bacterium]
MTASHFLLTGLLTLAVFVADAMAPLGVNIPLLYILPVMLASGGRDPRIGMTTSVGCLLLTIVGFFVSPSPEASVLWKAQTNRGMAVLAIGFTVVLSRRQRALLMRQEASERIHRVIDEAPSGMVMINADGAIVLANKTSLRMFEYEEAELLGQPIELLVPERFRVGHPASRDGFFAAPQPRSMGSGRDLAGRRKDGSEFPVEIGINPVKLADELFVLATVIDITERQQAEATLRAYAADLERSNRELDDFAYVASHDLRSPLEAIKNLSKWIVEDNADLLPDTSKRHLAMMQQRAGRLESLLDDLLQYSRAGRVHGQILKVDTGELVKEIAGLLNAPESYVVSVVGEMPTLVTAHTPLEQVFRNLINNAIKHRQQDDGRVEVSCRDLGAFYEFTVSDDGPGIAAEFHQQIFKLFQTLKPRDEVEGSGMGLAIVQKIVESYDGTIQVVSVPGPGVKFQFTWPKSLNPFAEDKS